MRTTLLLPAMTLLIAGAVRASEVFSMEPDWTYPVTGLHIPLRIAAACIDEDAFPDLVVGNTWLDNFTVFYGIGDGTFTLGEEYASTSPDWIELADIDNDCDIDLVLRTLINPTDSIAVYFNDGTGLFGSPVKSPGPWGEKDFAVFCVDYINNDPCLDLVSIRTSEYVYAMFGDGTGSFTSELIFTAEDEPIYGINCGDVDNDSDVDIVLICWGRLCVLLNDGDGSFTSNGYYEGFANEDHGSLGIGFLDSDDLPDIATMPGASYGDYSVYSFLGDGTGGFAVFGWWIDLGIAHYQASIDDYDLDGFNDAFFTGGGGNLLMLGDGTGNLQFDYFNYYLSYCQTAGVIDLDLDGDIDYVTASHHSPDPFRIEVFLNKTIQTGIGDSSTESANGSLFLEISENPVSVASEVHFFLPVSASSSLTVYDIHGREMDTILEGILSAGDHSVVWDVVDYPTGCYTLVLRTETASVSRRCIRI
ncbi:MAG: VCBS repeat-containing protein [Candidatus Fermentibacteraceae bacterium]|nr:VCBS repeat-containing protein [Candidatus Fermentibacteraceae bacterium]